MKQRLVEPSARALGAGGAGRPASQVCRREESSCRFADQSSWSLWASWSPWPRLCRPRPDPPDRAAEAVSPATCRNLTPRRWLILNNYYPGYWWDHTDLTIAVKAHPSATDEQVAAIQGAIATWSDVLEDCFDGLITLTDVTGSKRQAADIVVHYVPTAGGVVFGGYAICGDHGCPNILVRSDLPPSLDREPYDSGVPRLGDAARSWATPSGLGHATNLLESTDLMGYGWPDLGDPVLSQCDVEALAFVFAWALEGAEPYPPAEGPYVC